MIVPALVGDEWVPHEAWLTADQIAEAFANVQRESARRPFVDRK